MRTLCSLLRRLAQSVEDRVTAEYGNGVDLIGNHFIQKEKKTRKEKN